MIIFKNYNILICYGIKSLYVGLEIEGDGKDLDNFEVVVLWVDKIGVF